MCTFSTVSRLTQRNYGKMRETTQYTRAQCLSILFKVQVLRGSSCSTVENMNCTNDP